MFSIIKIESNNYKLSINKYQPSLMRTNLDPYNLNFPLNIKLLKNN